MQGRPEPCTPQEAKPAKRLAYAPATSAPPAHVARGPELLFRWVGRAVRAQATAYFLQARAPAGGCAKAMYKQSACCLAGRRPPRRGCASTTAPPPLPPACRQASRATPPLPNNQSERLASVLLPLLCRCCPPRPTPSRSTGLPLVPTCRRCRCVRRGCRVDRPRNSCSRRHSPAKTIHPPCCQVQDVRGGRLRGRPARRVARGGRDAALPGLCAGGGVGRGHSRATCKEGAGESSDSNTHTRNGRTATAPLLYRRSTRRTAGPTLCSPRCALLWRRT